MRLLVVDDNPEIARLLAMRFELEDNGFDLTVVTEDFEVGVRTALAAGVDVLVLDLWLQGKGFTEGYPMAHLLFDLARRTNPAVKVIIYSAVVGLRHDASIELLADIVLHKPDMEQLVRMVRQLAYPV